MYDYSKESLHSILHGTEVVLHFTGFFKSFSLLKVLPFKLNKSFTNERFMSFAVVHSFLDPLSLIVLILWCDFHSATGRSSTKELFYICAVKNWILYRYIGHSRYITLDQICYTGWSYNVPCVCSFARTSVHPLV